MSVLRRLLRIILAAALALITLAGLAAAGLLVTLSQPGDLRSSSGPVPVPAGHPAPDGALVVAVVLGVSGTVGSDALAPYEVFARSSRFSVYTVAASGRPAPTEGGPAIVPAFTFDDVRAGRAAPPDVVVVPAVTDPDGPAEAALRTWVLGQLHRGARILAVCNGSRVLAATGMLDGRRATAHWSRLGAQRRQHPAVGWVSGQRFVQDGPITTTAGVTSGIPGALRVMADLAGPAEATRVGRIVRYPDWSLTQDPAIPVRSFSRADLPIGLNALIPWGRPVIGIGLADGVGELDAASVVEVYGVSYAARAVPLTTHGFVTTRHGVVLLGRTPAEAGPISRLVVPGTDDPSTADPVLRRWAVQHRIPVDAVRQWRDEPAFDAALEHLSAHSGRATAISAAKMIDYPVTRLRLAAPAPGPRIPVLLVLELALAGGAGAVPQIIRSNRTSRTSRTSRISRARPVARPRAGRGAPAATGGSA